MTSEMLLGTVVAGLIVTLIGWLARTPVSALSKRRSRRREIVHGVRGAEELVYRALREGHYEKAWLQDWEPLDMAYTNYRDLIVKVLNKFESGEEEVAMWTLVELYSGWHEPLTLLVDMNPPQTAPAPGDPPLISPDDPRLTLPRHRTLGRWVTSWRWGNANGPRYGTLDEPGDLSRHEVCPPNTDAVSDILRLVEWNPPEYPRRISRRTRKRLIKDYDWSEAEVLRRIQIWQQREFPDVPSQED